MFDVGVHVSHYRGEKKLRRLIWCVFFIPLYRFFFHGYSKASRRFLTCRMNQIPSINCASELERKRGGFIYKRLLPTGSRPPLRHVYISYVTVVPCNIAMCVAIQVRAIDRSTFLRCSLIVKQRQ